MDTPFLPYGRQLIDDDDVIAVTAVLKGEFLTTGPAVPAFEAALAKTTGAAHAISCSSGTAALHLAAMALRLGPGDKVVVPSITFLATANAARYVGAEVVFADVAPDTGLMGAQELSAAIERAGDGVKAVFPVHLAGQMTDMAAIHTVADKHGLKVVEDACHAIGTSRGNAERTGDCRYGDMACFSFHPVKTIAMGEGGAITTNDDHLAARLRHLRSHGMTHDADGFQNRDMGLDEGGDANPWYYEMTECGFNYRASDLHCALGSSQLEKLDRFVSARASIVAAYDQALAALRPTVSPLARNADCTAAWHLYVALIDFARAGVSRSQVMHSLWARGIGTQVHYIPVHSQPYYRNLYGDLSLPGAEQYYQRCLSLPLSASMTSDDVTRVVDALADALQMEV